MMNKSGWKAEEQNDDKEGGIETEKGKETYGQQPGGNVESFWRKSPKAFNVIPPSVVLFGIPHDE